MRNFKFWWFHRKDLVEIYQNQPFLNFRIYLLSIKILFKMKELYFLELSCSFFNYFQSTVIIKVTMIASERSHEYLSENI